jgi:WD40 repeat protein
VVSFSSQRSLSALSTSPDGRFVVAAGALATVYVYDLDAALLTRYVGHNAPIGQVAALGDPAAPLVSADMNGVMRVWDLPRPGRRVVMRGVKAIFRAVFSPDSRYLVADGADGIIRVLDRTLGQLTELRGHTDMVYGIAFPPGRDDEVASWGYDGTVRIWSLVQRAALRVLTGHKGLVKDGDYIDRDTLVTIGIDGRVLAWDPGGAPRELFHVEESLVSLEALRPLGSVVVTAASGDVYLVSARGDARQLSSDGQSITMLRAAPNGRQFATGTADGTVRVYGEDGAGRVALRASGPIRHIAFSADSTLLAVASEDGRVHLHAMEGGLAPWGEVALRARYVAFSPAGHLLAITCNDGTVWVYSLRDRRWSFAQPHAADTYTGQFSPDGDAFASSDSAGVVVLHRIPEIERELRESEGEPR